MRFPKDMHETYFLSDPLCIWGMVSRAWLKQLLYDKKKTVLQIVYMSKRNLYSGQTVTVFLFLMLLWP